MATNMSSCPYCELPMSAGRTEHCGNFVCAAAYSRATGGETPVEPEPAPEPADERPEVAMGAAGRALWNSIIPEYSLRPDETRVLVDACRQADLIAELDRDRQGQPTTTRGSMGQEVINPYISELRAHRTVMMNLLKALKLPEDSARTANKTTRTSEQARKAARARWGTKAG